MKLAEALNISRRNPPDGKEFKVFLGCGFQPLHLETFLKAHLCLLFPQRKVQISTGLYGNLAGNLKRFEKDSFDAGTVFLEWGDLDIRLGMRALGGWTSEVLPDIVKGARAQSQRVSRILKRLAKKIPLALSLPSIPIAPVSHFPPHLSGSFESSLGTIISDFEEEIIKIPGVRMVNAAEIDFHFNTAERLDLKSEINTGFPYQLPYASFLAELVALLVKSPPPKKGLVTDLDDTLWRGILGEAGIQGITWDLDHHTHIHALYQQMLCSLAKTGVLIGVASKNNPDLVEEAFKREDILLPRNLVFPLEAGWGLKSDSIGRILKAWNINPESIVFIDDSPMELAEVKRVYPDIECLRFPVQNENEFFHLLRKLRAHFGKESIQQEDILRLESLKRSRHEKDGDTESVPHDDSFLKEAHATLSYSFQNDLKDTRAFELVNKTNQFNLNGERYTEGEWQAALTKENHFLFTASYEDKYGPLGEIAVIVGCVEQDKVCMQTWVMSCRAFSRRIEHLCLKLLFEHFDAREIEFAFKATDRNEPLREFFEPFLGNKPGEKFSLTHKRIIEICPPVYISPRSIDDE